MTRDRIQPPVPANPHKVSRMPAGSHRRTDPGAPATVDRAGSARIPAAAVAAFFLSGAASLIYEVCWIRRASLVFGSTIYALSTVLATFFVGLALGSYALGRLSTRFARPIRVYAWLEGVLAMLALVSLPAFDLAGQAFGRAYESLPDVPVLLGITRFAIVAAIVLVPAAIMGGTLPLFCRQFVLSQERIGRSVGRLYAVNTLGAATGTALAGGALIPSIGLSGSVLLGAGLSLAAGAIALWIDRVGAFAAPASIERAPHRPSPSRAGLAVLIFLSGFTALGYEVLWTRFLGLVTHNTVHTYTVTLTVVLLGIVVGSVLASRIVDRSRMRGAWFGGLQAAAGLAVLGTMLLPPSAWRGFQGGLQIYALLLLPAAVLSGASFPIGVRMAVDHPASAGGGVGWVYSVNTLGGIAGSLICGFLLLPGFGLHAGLLTCTGLSVGTGILAWWLAGGAAAARWIAAAVATVAWLLLPRALGTHLPHDFLGAPGGLVDVREGLQSNLAVLWRDDDLVLEIDRWWQGQRRPTQQIMAAHIPMILHPRPRRVLVVGVGAGQTPSRMTCHDIERLDCVDIEPAVFDLVRRHFEASWLSDPRVRIIADDGRNLIARSPERYDVISIEVGQIFRPGVPAFYTTDFYRLARSRLRPGGLVSQLVKLSLPTDVFRGVVASFLEVFPQSVLWYNTGECLLIGTEAGRMAFDRSRLAQAASNSAIRADLTQRFYGDTSYALQNPHAFWGGLILGPEGLATLCPGTRPFHDDPPVLDYLATRAAEPRPENVLLRASQLRRVDDHPLRQILRPPLPDDRLEMAERVRRLNVGQLEAEAFLSRARRVARGTEAYEQLLAQALHANPENLLANRLMGEALVAGGRAGQAVPYFETAIRIEPRDPRLLTALGSLWLGLARPADAIPYLRAAAMLEPDNADALRRLEAATAALGRKQ